jgi:hypothetical protein
MTPFSLSFRAKRKIARFAPLEFAAGCGLDALYVPWRSPAASICGVLVRGVECVPSRADDGRRFVLATAGCAFADAVLG